MKAMTGHSAPYFLRKVLSQTMWAALLTLCVQAVVAQDLQAKALDVAALLRETEAAVRLVGGLKVQAQKEAVREGEALVLQIQVPRAGYLNVVSINAEGVPTVLFPNQVQAENRVEPGAFTLPTPQMAFELQASAPFGPTTVAAFLTQTPLDLHAGGEGAALAGNALGPFARWSVVGRDVINALSTQSWAQSGLNTRMAAGMTTVLTCAKDGPCEQPKPPRVGGRLQQLLGAFVPGILLEPEDKALAQPNAALRPVIEPGLVLTKASEGFVPRLYEDAAGYCSIAYGHLIRLARCAAEERGTYRRGISEPAGAQLLHQDMAKAQRAVMKLVSAPLTDAQFAALCDFTYNVGSGNLRRSTLLKAVNAQQHHRVPFQLRRWVRAGGTEYRGLKIRRERELALYFQGQDIPKVVPKGEDESLLDIRAGESAQ
jgi:lysozyme